MLIGRLARLPQPRDDSATATCNSTVFISSKQSEFCQPSTEWLLVCVSVGRCRRRRKHLLSVCWTSGQDNRNECWVINDRQSSVRCLIHTVVQLHAQDVLQSLSMTLLNKLTYLLKTLTAECQVERTLKIGELLATLPLQCHPVGRCLVFCATCITPAV